MMRCIHVSKGFVLYNNATDKTVSEMGRPTIFQRIAAKDISAVSECLNKHGRLVWALARQFTTSSKEAESAAQEIFLEMWKCAERFDSAKCEENDFIVLIARRWFIKRKIESVLASRTNSDTSA